MFRPIRITSLPCRLRLYVLKHVLPSIVEAINIKPCLCKLGVRLKKGSCKSPVFFPEILVKSSDGRCVAIDVEILEKPSKKLSFQQGRMLSDRFAHVILSWAEKQRVIVGSHNTL